MPDKKFDLGDYVEVKDRIKLFYELYGQGRLTTTYELTDAPDGKARVICRALAYRSPDDLIPATGTSWMELPGNTPYTKGSEVENAETSAIGRAIGFLGILIDRSIATTNEIESKAGADAPRVNTPADGSLIGTVEIGKAPSDFELRTGPNGSAISFRLKEGRSSIKVVALDPLASALALIKAEIIGQRVTCWGTVSIESFQKDGKTIEYRVLALSRIQTPDLLLPAPDEALDPELQTIPLFAEATA